MFHEQTLFSLFNSLTILKELVISLLHRTTSLHPRFFTLPSISFLVLIQFVEKLVNILISKFFFSSFLSGPIDKKGEKTKILCILYFFTIVIHVHVLLMNTNLLLYLNYYLVYVIRVFLRLSQILSSSQKGRDYWVAFYASHYFSFYILGWS